MLTEKTNGGHGVATPRPPMLSGPVTGSVLLRCHEDRRLGMALGVALLDEASVAGIVRLRLWFLGHHRLLSRSCWPRRIYRHRLSLAPMLSSAPENVAGSRLRRLSTLPPRRQKDPGKARMEGFPASSDAKLSTGSVERLPHAGIPARRVEPMFESKKRPIRGRKTGATPQPGREDGRQSTPYDPNHGTSTTRTAHTRAPDARHLGERNGMKKILEDMIIKWHQCGYSVEEIHQGMPQVTIDQIRATIIHRHEA